MKKIITLLTCIIYYTAISQNYAPDSNFGSNGETVYNNIVFKPKNVILENNNYYLISNDKLSKVSYNGNRDLTFGTSGFISLTATGQTFTINNFKVINSFIYLSGKTTNSQGEDLFIAKLNLSGEFDNSFGSNGIQIVNFGANESLSDIVLDSQGNLFCIGSRQVPVGNNYTNRLIYFKLNPSGVINTVFDPNGYKELSVNIDTWGEKILPYNDNYILAGISRRGSINGLYDDLLISQIDENGNLITSFGTNGNITKQPLYGGMTNSLKEVYVQDNTIHARYFYSYSYNTQGSCVIGYNFSNNTEIYHFETYYNSFLNVNNNGIYISGNARCNFSECGRSSYITKRNFDGVIDTNFGTNGSYTISSPAGLFIADVALTPFTIENNNNITLAGYIQRFKPGVIDQNGFAMTRIVPGNLSINDFEKNDLTIYPNPFSDHVTINSEKEIKEIEIYNALGEKINQGFNFNKETSVLDLSKINPAGVYLIRMISKDNNVSYKKIIKQ